MTPKHHKAYRQRCSEDEPYGPPKRGPERRRRNHGDGRKPCATAVDHRLDELAHDRLDSKKKR